MTLRSLVPLVLLPLGLTAPAPALPAPHPGAAAGLPLLQGTPYLARTVGATTPVYAWSDRNSKVVRSLPAGSLVQVHEELELKGGEVELRYAEVSVADGLEVWVYGQFLEPTGREGVLRCTGDNVRMRPGAGKSTVNLPISTHLMRGDEVRLLGRNDESLPMAEDWIRVRSPQHARAWVLAEALQPVVDEAAAQAEWSAAAPREQGIPASETAELGQGTPVPAAATGSALMAEADALFQRARDGQGSYTDAVAAYERVLEETSPGSGLHTLAASQLERARYGVELEQLEAELERREAEKDLAEREAVLDRQREELADTLHWGRFNGRGWVRPRTVDGQRRWFLEWQGEVVREITCRSRRYRLDAFEDCEVGVQGDVLRNPTPASFGVDARPQLLDVTRVEIISVRL